MNPNTEIDIDAAFEQGTPIDEAMNEGVREAVARHRQAGLPLVVWEDGKTVWVQPEETTGPPLTHDDNRE